MRKRLSILLLCIGLIVWAVEPIRAHIEGAFQDFLVGLQDEDSTKELEETIQTTESQHVVLSEKAKEQKNEFIKEQEKMLSKLMFYDTVAFDTYASFILENEEMVDAMANQKVMQKQVNKDLETLESFYHQYQSLQQALHSVEGYQELLQDIKQNRQAKERLSEIFPNLEKTDKQQFATLLQAIWSQNMQKVDEHLEKDSKMISAHLGEWIEESSTNGIHTIDYRIINKHSTLRYLIQRDHMYVTYKKGDGHVILITQLVRHPKEKTAYYLQMEAGFLNGYALSKEILQGLNGKFVIRYDALQTKDQSTWLIQQTSNALVFQPSGTIMN